MNGKLLQTEFLELNLSTHLLTAMKQFVLFLLCLCTTASAQTVPTSDHTRHVDLFIGTAGHGHTHPAAVVPHGMVQPGPDTRRYGWDACSGYHYSDSTINGFAYTRLSGTGCADFGDFLIMPITGKPQKEHDAPVPTEHQQTPWASAFSHNEEEASPGYYAVHLQRYGIFAEMTATERAAIHRFTYPANEEAGLILSLDYGIQGQRTLEADVTFVDDSTLCARRRGFWWTYDRDVYLYAKFSTRYKAKVERDTIYVNGKPRLHCRIFLHFPEAAGHSVLMRAGLSAVDAAGAKSNLAVEIPTFNFERVRQMAHAKWAAELGRIDITPVEGTPGEEQLRTFYTALYHTAIAPIVFSDADGRYRGMDLQIHQGEPTSPNYTIFSLWDTFRALHPLVSILSPEQNEAYIRALLRKAEEGGTLPKWDCASNYTGCMIGYHAASLIADAYTKGYRDFDAHAALKACLRAAQGDTSGLVPAVPKYKMRELLPEGRRLKTALGYIPCDKENEAVAKALEYAYNDWCIATLAETLDRHDTARIYNDYAQSYRRYYDASTGFMRGVDSQGKWRIPFDPRRSEHRSDDYCEGNAWQWTWFAPHDIPGLVRLMGGRDAFTARLDSLFSVSSEITGSLVSSDISGMIGQYAHGNEPGHHIPYLYNYVGQPHRTQEICDSILHTLYTATPDGLAGNEDCGQMSAWYILSAIGLYQVCPGRPEWTIGRPLFSRAVIHLPKERTFTVIAEGNSRDAKYVRRMTLNGKALKTPFITHADIMKGGVLHLEMSRKNKAK